MKWFWWVGGVVVLVVVVGVLSFVFIFNKNSGNENMKSSNFAAVYMTSGDIYFGKLDWFPWPRLQNVWYLQRGLDQKQQPQAGIAPFKDVFWTPIDEVYLNPKEIVFWTKIKAGTQLDQALTNPDAFRQQIQAQQQAGKPAQAGQSPSALPPAAK